MSTLSPQRALRAPFLQAGCRSPRCAVPMRLIGALAAVAPATLALAGPVLDPNSILPYVDGFVTCRLLGELPAGIEPSLTWVANLEPVRSLGGFAVPHLYWDAPYGHQPWSTLTLDGEWLPYAQGGSGSGAGFWLWGLGGGSHETGGILPSVAVPGSQLPVVPLPSALLLCGAAAPILALAWRVRRRRLGA
jgi:hypothetical protein